MPWFCCLLIGVMHLSLDACVGFSLIRHWWEREGERDINVVVCINMCIRYYVLRIAKKSPSTKALHLSSFVVLHLKHPITFRWDAQRRSNHQMITANTVCRIVDVKFLAVMPVCLRKAKLGLPFNILSYWIERWFIQSFICSLFLWIICQENGCIECKRVFNADDSGYCGFINISYTRAIHFMPL